MLDEVKQRRAYRQSSPRRRRGRPHRPLRRSRMPRIVPRSRFPTHKALRRVLKIHESTHLVIPKSLPATEKAPDF